jgi:hypothetical protein
VTMMQDCPLVFPCGRCTACKWMLTSPPIYPRTVRFTETTDGSVHFVEFQAGSTLPVRMWTERKNLDVVPKF